jgi:hypothetical protein
MLCEQQEWDPFCTEHTGEFKINALICRFLNKAVITAYVIKHRMGCENDLDWGAGDGSIEFYEYFQGIC